MFSGQELGKLKLILKLKKSGVENLYYCLFKGTGSPRN
jgi:hypothetical protein